MSSVIKVENLSKQYRLGLVNSTTMRDDAKRWWYNIRGKENPLLKVGEKNDRTVVGESEYVWSLRDINFEVEQGKILGIIGRNGAGKSTLLKILSKVTAPTTGIIKSKGRIASLLEVGTGFHPELTGRENIYLNGAILGMRRSEITRKLDEIIAFAGVERYINTPVKRYSSGMYVRLAFAVAAHLESEILIIDEVLAVGDAEFQKKCLGKMGEVSASEGRTILFVSHNMSAVKELCNEVLILKDGLIQQIGNTNQAIRDYLINPATINLKSDLLSDYESRRGNGEIRFTNIKINEGREILDPLEPIVISIGAICMKTVEELYFSLTIKNPGDAGYLAGKLVCVSANPLNEGQEIQFELTIQANFCRTGLFPLMFWMGKQMALGADYYPYDIIDSVHYLNINSDKSTIELGYSSAAPGSYFNLPYRIEQINIH